MNILRQLAYQTLLSLSTDEGINASGKEEVFGCIFGRDSAITILKILRAHSKKPALDLLAICRKALLNLVTLQGSEFNIESGEEPGKFIHEFRKDNYQHVIEKYGPRFIYPNGFLKNYDSIDSTPLGLITLYNYYQITDDQEFLVTVLPHVEAGLNWIITFGDKDKDLFIEYDFPTVRKFAGSRVQSWTDSEESIMQANGKMPLYPIAPVEAQAYAWLALKLWADFYKDHSAKFAKKLSIYARDLKKKFNEQFIIEDNGALYAAQALDGNKNQIKTVTANSLLCLFASYKSECILKEEFIGDFVKRAFMKDMFVEDAGIRTMSSRSETFNPNQDSYHNGSFWPMLNGLIVEGLENFGFQEEANLLKRASIKAVEHFGCPIEVYIKTGDSYIEWRSSNGHSSCMSQAWSAAGILDILTD